MCTIVYVIYFSLKREEKRRREKGKKESEFIRFLLGYCEWFYNIPYRRWMEKHPSNRYGLNKKNRSKRIIVSLTSYPKRIDTVWLTIETLMRQTVKPDKIILWLANSQFSGVESLPSELVKLQERGLTIRFCDDLRSHKKYYYVMQEFPEDLVILADDDMFYPYDTIKKLLAMWKKHPDDICTMAGQVMEPTFITKPSIWRNPYLYERFEHSSKIQAFTGSGSLYPPDSLNKMAFDSGKIMQFCPYADDLWLTYMAHKKGTRITVQSPWRAFPVTIYGTGEDSLYYVNAEGGQNDVQWIQINTYLSDEK